MANTIGARQLRRTRPLAAWRKKPGTVAERLDDRRGQVLAYAAACKNLIGPAILRDQSEAPRLCGLRVSAVERATVYLDHAFGRRDAEDRLRDLGSAGAHQPRYTEDFAGAKLEADAIKQSAVGDVLH